MPVATSFDHEPTELEALIVGGGVSGIASACRFQMDLGLTNFLIFEKSEALGGTWQNNRYPGVGCDIPTRLYSLSFSQKTSWDQFFSLGPEIRDYLQEVARRFNLEPRARLNTEVLSAQWIAARTHWRVVTRNAAGEERVHTARVLVSGVGALSIPRDCDVPGHESFKGPLFHSANWPKNVDLTGKRVVILGNGCSAAQIVPTLAPKVKHITQIARSKHWIVPQLDNPLEGPTGRWLERWVPGFTALERMLVILFCESHFLQTFKKDGVYARDRFAKLSRTYITRAAPAKYHDVLMPARGEVQVACKRRIFDAGYIPSLNRDNVELTTDQAAEITEHGVTLKSGRKIEADVIVLANGFKTDGEQPMDIINGEGVTLQQHWKQTGGVPQAYRGTLVSGFENLFLIWGPNTVTGHFSAIFSIERCVELMTSVLRPVFLPSANNALARASNGPLQRSEGRTVQVRASAEELEQLWIQDSMSRKIFTTGCGSWYTDPATGKVTALAPTFQIAVALRCAFPVFADYEYKGVRRMDAWRAWTWGQKVGALLRLGRTPDVRSNEEARRGVLHVILRAVLLNPAYRVFAFIGIWLLRASSLTVDAITPWKLPRANSRVKLA